MKHRIIECQEQFQDFDKFVCAIGLSKLMSSTESSLRNEITDRHPVNAFKHFKVNQDKDIKLLENFWKKIGSKVDIMDAKQHDYILSITSHIPHLIAYNIVNTSINIQDEKESSIVKYSAGGLRDFTRIAASNPIMWRDVFIQNKKNTSEMIDKFIENLEGLKKAIENEDGKKLEEIFTKTQKIRKEIIEAGQDVSKPDFGRK